MAESMCVKYIQCRSSYFDDSRIGRIYYGIGLQEQT